MEVPIAFILGILYHALILLASVVGEEESIFMYDKKEPRQVFFKFYDDYADNFLSFMTGEQVKTFMLALVDYHRDGIIPEFSDPLLAMAFRTVSGNIDRDMEKYLEMCDRNKQNAQRRKERLEELGIDMM